MHRQEGIFVHFHYPQLVREVALSVKCTVGEINASRRFANPDVPFVFNPVNILNSSPWIMVSIQTKFILLGICQSDLFGGMAINLFIYNYLQLASLKSMVI